MLMFDTLYNKLTPFGFKLIKFILAFLLVGLSVHFGFIRPRGNYADSEGILGSFQFLAAGATLGLFLLYRAGMWTRKILIWKDSARVKPQNGKPKLPVWARDILFELLLALLVALPIYAGIASIGQSFETYSLSLVFLRLAAPFCIFFGIGLIVSEHTPVIYNTHG